MDTVNFNAPGEFSLNPKGMQRQVKLITRNNSCEI